MKNENNLFTEYKLNHLLTLKNRILMAPMTRAKADIDSVPTTEMVAYYARRADAGLIVTEGTLINKDAGSFAQAPGIYNEAQINNWKKVTDAVHEKNGLIFLQIWHVGRVSHPDYLNGQLPVSASETVMTGNVYRSNGLTYGKSRALTQSEINELIACYATAAKNAMLAGFDGIEIHGANGYLIDQFLHYDTNKREDEYGGNPQHMSRFALEIIKACGDAIGYERVGIRLSPGAYLNEIVGDKRDAEVFKYLLTQLNNNPIAYVHTGNFNDTQKFPELSEQTMTDFIRSTYKGVVIACGSYNTQTAQKGISNKDFDLIAIGRSFIANPDLIEKLQTNNPLITYDASMLATLI